MLFVVLKGIVLRHKTGQCERTVTAVITRLRCVLGHHRREQTPTEELVMFVPYMKFTRATT